MSIHVFLGPSLSWEEARELLPDATFLPPAKAGDVYLAVKNDAKVIAIIDGVFEQVPSVWHKEVLYALSHGVHVFGASSMGALRAAELHRFGMVGVGRIFEAYRDSICEDDDEVAVSHAGPELGFRVFSEAMVNVRYGLSQALERGLISQATFDTILREMKRRNYSQRSWLLVPVFAENEKLPGAEVDALLEFVRSERPDRKRLDALELLTELRRVSESLSSPFEAKFEFESTVFWDQLVAGVRTGPGPSASAQVPIEAIRSHVGVVEEDAEDLFRGALLLYLVVKEAHRSGLKIDSHKVKQVTERFLQSHDLPTPVATDEWRRKNLLGEVEFSALMEVLTLVETVAKHHSMALDAFLPAELQRRGRFESVAAAISEKRGALADFGITFPSPEDVGTTTDDLLTWYETRFRKFDSSLEEHIDVRRVMDVPRFIREVLSEYIREGNHKKLTVKVDA
jgi:hypothetical protein